MPPPGFGDNFFFSSFLSSFFLSPSFLSPSFFSSAFWNLSAFATAQPADQEEIVKICGDPSLRR